MKAKCCSISVETPGKLTSGKKIPPEGEARSIQMLMRTRIENFRSAEYLNQAEGD